MLPQNINNGAITFVNADGTTPKAVFTAGANDSILGMLSACSTDTSAVKCQVFLYDGSTNWLVGTVNVPTLSGTDGSANAIDLLNSTALPFCDLSDSGKRIIKVKTGWSVRVAPVSAVTSTKTLTVVAAGDDF